MIAGLALTAFGALALAISLLEIASLFAETGDAVRKLARMVIGRPDTGATQMQNAMFWMQIIGLLTIGGAMLAAGLSILGN